MTRDRAAALALCTVSHETAARLDAFVALLDIWQKTTNLVSPTSLPQIWMRHIADSLQIATLSPDAKRWLDIGSGGGFPGIVLACLACETGGHVTLVERNAKKAAFLREALRVTGGRGDVRLGDIGDCAADDPADIDTVTARAVAPLPDLLKMAAPWLAEGARGIFPKGQDVVAEMNSASTSWDFDAVCAPSRTGNGTLVVVSRFGGPKR